MFSSIGRTFDILKQSWRAILADKELLALPIFGLVASGLLIGILGAIAVAVFLSAAEASTALYAVLVALAIAAYFLSAFFLMFANAALVAGVLERVRGGDPTIRSALAAARANVGAIFLWSLIATTVSLILSSARQRAGEEGGGGFLAMLGLTVLAAAWSLITFFAVPVLVAEKVGPIAALKRSFDIFKKTWGTQVTARFAFGLFYFIAALPGVGVGALLYWITSSFAADGVAIAVGGIVGGALVLLASGFIHVLTSVFRAILYDYAVRGFGKPAAEVDREREEATQADGKAKGYRVFKADYLQSAYGDRRAGGLFR